MLSQSWRRKKFQWKADNNNNNNNKRFAYFMSKEKVTASAYNYLTARHQVSSEKLNCWLTATNQTRRACLISGFRSVWMANAIWNNKNVQHIFTTYSHHLNNGPVRYSNGSHKSNSWMVRNSVHDLNNIQIIYVIQMVKLITWQLLYKLQTTNSPQIGWFHYSTHSGWFH